MRMNYSYSRDYILTANFLMMLLLPLVLISVMNTLIFLTIRRSSRNVTHVTSRQRRDRKVLLYSVHTVTCVPLHLDEGMRVSQDGRKLLFGKKLTFMGYMMSKDSCQKKEYSKGMAK